MMINRVQRTEIIVGHRHRNTALRARLHDSLPPFEQNPE